MSKKNVTQFLADAAQDRALREKFQVANSSDEFLSIARQLGYSFTTEELQNVIHDYSQGIEVSRHTGVWPWLRSVHWI
jgi:predicted ribosomally synthesized peptide with nif11-like leader